MSNPPAEKTNFELLRWMFSFLKPVKSIAVLACSLLVVWIAIDIATTREMGKAVDLIKVIHFKDTSVQTGFWRWLASADPSARALRGVMAVLAVLMIVNTVLRYFRETANMRLSMTMVYYIREAVYDKIQRGGIL